MQLRTDPKTGLYLPKALNEDKTSLKECISEVVEKAINAVPFRDNYFLVLHAKFDPLEPDTFVISRMAASLKLPPFSSNSMVFWVSPSRGICEILWMVAPKVKGQKLKVEFNKEGVAYLQAKGVKLILGR